MRTKELVAKLSWKQVQKYIKKKGSYRLPTFEELKEIDTEHREIWFNGRQVMDDVYGDRMGVYDFKYDTVAYANPRFKINTVLVKENG